jgi:hypothetical protein
MMAKKKDLWLAADLFLDDSLLSDETALGTW